jgi:hypothetical protein
MFEKTSRLAEKLATSVSRRDFLGSLGRWAGATALAVAGVIMTPAIASSAGQVCCYCPALIGAPASCRKVNKSNDCTGYYCYLVDCKQVSICPA